MAPTRAPTQGPAVAAAGARSPLRPRVRTADFTPGSGTRVAVTTAAITEADVAWAAGVHADRAAEADGSQQAVQCLRVCGCGKQEGWRRRIRRRALCRAPHARACAALARPAAHAFASGGWGWRLECGRRPSRGGGRRRHGPCRRRRSPRASMRPTAGSRRAPSISVRLRLLSRRGLRRSSRQPCLPPSPTIASCAASPHARRHPARSARRRQKGRGRGGASDASPPAGTATCSAATWRRRRRCRWRQRRRRRPTRRWSPRKPKCRRHKPGSVPAAAAPGTSRRFLHAARVAQQRASCLYRLAATRACCCPSVSRLSRGSSKWGRRGGRQ